MNTYNPPPLPQLLLDVCDSLDIDVNDVLSKSRKRKRAWCRHIFCYVAYIYTKYPIGEISKIVGGRDHTTGMHSRNTAQDYISKNDIDFMPMWERYMQLSVYFRDLKQIRVIRSIHRNIKKNGKQETVA